MLVYSDNYISLFVKPFQSLDPTLNYCVGLSGGLDSRWIANELIHLPKKCAYTFSEKKSYDLSLAKNVCDALNIRHHLLDIQNEKISDRIQAFCNVQHTCILDIYMKVSLWILEFQMLMFYSMDFMAEVCIRVDTH